MIPEKISRYEIKQELGRGGMATVYEAYDPLFQRPVAVKMLPREFLHDPEFRARFTREARTIAALEHPAIVPVYDFGEENEQPFLVMRLMTGGSLSDRLVQGPLAVEQAAEILKRIGLALDRAHSQGIIHRDLKPSNILFDQYGDAFLADFGIARIASASSQLTASGSLVGTPAYMSPEQVYGNKELDGRSDIYALGVILYQMLTGDVPFNADTPARMMMAHVMDPIPHLVDKRPDLAPCGHVITRAMAKERDDRFSTASDMTGALAEITQKMKQPDFAALPAAEESAPALATVAETAPPPEIDTPAAIADTAVPQPLLAAEPQPSPAKASSFDEPVYAGQIAVAPAGAKTPLWLWGLFGALALACLAGAVGGSFLLVRLLGNGDETPTAVAAGPDDATPTTEQVIFESLATDTPLPPPTPTAEAVHTAEGADIVVETAVPVADNPALATRQSLEATRLAAVGSQSDNSGSNGSADVVATRQSVEATRAAAVQPPNLFGDLDELSPLYGPEQGTLPHTPDNNLIELVYPDVTPVDFVLNITFINPYDPATGGWDFGVIFRQAAPDEELRLVVRSNGSWSLNNRQEEEDAFLQDGDVAEHLALAAEESNQLTLITSGDTGYFFLNEAFVAVLDLSARVEAGEIAVGTGFYTTSERAGAVTAYEDFAVWALTPVFGPDSGELVHALDDVIKLHESGVNARNFVASATFLNPFASAVNDWDIGFSFRDDDDGTKYWLVAASEGEWELVVRYGDADSDTTRQNGDLDNLNTAAGESNKIVIVVWGESGFFFLNGELVEQLDLFDISDSGDVEILTAFYFDHEVEGDATGYEAFTIWPLP